MEHVIPQAKTTTTGSDQDEGELDAISEGEGETEVVRDKSPIPLKDISPEIAALGVTTFDDLPIHPTILEAIRTIGWATPTPVQKLCLPFSLRGRDVAGFAQTGTGKTAVFLITILNKLLNASTADSQAQGRVPRAIVIAPTRELAMQSEQDAQDLFARTGIKSMAVFGGIDYEKQAREIKDGVDVIFATPGRLKDYIQKKVVNLQNITCFVCDEADRMFDMGFIEDVEFFLERIPEEAQRLLFSATTNDQVKELAFEYLENPEYISVNPETITPEKIEQHALHCHATDKLKVLLGLMEDHKPDCAVIFTNTKLTAEWLYFKLQNNGVDADLISGDLPQKKRISLIHRIKEGKIKALVATDVASRGLHISRITHVYNFDLPDDASNYIHRIGRTARAGAKGYAYSLVCDDYGQNLGPINDLLGHLALHTEWPDDRYLTIVDKAGNPFEERYAARRERNGGDRPAYGSGGGDRPSYGGGGARSGGRSGRDDNRGGRGGRDDNRGPRPARSNPEDRPQRAAGNQGGGSQGGADRPQGSSAEGDKKRRKRRRGGGGQGRDQQEGGAPLQGQQGGQPRQDNKNRQGGQQQHSRDRNHQRPMGAEPVVAASQQPDLDTTPKSVGGMLKKLAKTLFGWGK